MNNCSFPYGIFNQQALAQLQLQQAEQQRQVEQQKNIYDMVKAIKDYCEAAKKVAPDYQQQAMDACMAEILLQMKIYGGTNR